MMNISYWATFTNFISRRTITVRISGATAAAGIAALFLAAATLSVSAATLDGATIRATANFPVIGGPTVGGPVDAVVGAGVEFTDGQFGAFFGPSFDFSGNTITITHANTSHSSGTFNGYIFNDLLNMLGNFTGLSVLSDSTGKFSGDPSRLGFDANNLFVNFQGLNFGSDQNPTIVLGIQMASTTPVPLPASLPLLAAGMAGLVALRRRKAAQA